jgi:hypothetical protein
MATIVIVTSQCYLLCEAINHITMHDAEEPCEAKEEEFGLSRRRRQHKKRRLTAKQKKAIAFAKLNQKYQIVIDFVPVSGSSPHLVHGGGSGRENSTTVSITVRGRERCEALFSEMVEQIREQLPDNVFLNQLAERFLSEYSKKESV